MDIDLTKLMQSGNILYIVIAICLFWAYKNGYLGKQPEPKPVDPAKPDGGGGSSTPLLDLIIPFLKRLLLGGAAVQALTPVDDDAALLGLATALKKDPEKARKLKDLL